MYTEEVKTFLENLPTSVYKYLETYNFISGFYVPVSYAIKLKNKEWITLTYESYYDPQHMDIKISHLFNYDEWLPALKKEVEEKKARLGEFERSRAKKIEAEEREFLRKLKAKYETV